ncbi:hypothetical protein LX32DRAFT_713553 [Colletotrichum zoysiae]|uniref:Uncharacterized protein n=1 Tax=Colletotrichum zoysiae TaxID=1216348 RepID=A0AAD9H4Q8_9PEZI|nr:hypothetical protein LX32DRAFT_713553 [Colletotrichum zoysiae]
MRNSGGIGCKTASYQGSGMAHDAESPSQVRAHFTQPDVHYRTTVHLPPNMLIEVSAMCNAHYTQEDSQDNDNNDTEVFIFMSPPPPLNPLGASSELNANPSSDITQPGDTIPQLAAASANSLSAHGKIIYGAGHSNASQFNVDILWDNFLKGSTINYGRNPPNAYALCWGEIVDVIVEEDVYSGAFMNYVKVTMFLAKSDQAILKGLGDASITLYTSFSYFRNRPTGQPTANWTLRQHGGNWKIQGVRD